MQFFLWKIAAQSTISLNKIIKILQNCKKHEYFSNLANIIKYNPLIQAELRVLAKFDKINEIQYNAIEVLKRRKKYEEKAKNF